MTQKELEKLLKQKDLRKQMQQGLFSDPGLWLPAEEQSLQEQEKLARKQQIRAQMKAEAFERSRQEQRKLLRISRPVMAMAASAAALVLFFTVAPVGRSIASSFFAKAARKVAGHVVIDSEGEAPPDVVRPDDMKISGVDGFSVRQYQTLAQLMQETGLNPVVLSAGYIDVVDILYEEQQGEYQDLLISYTIAEDSYITTTQSFAEGGREHRPKKSSAHTVLDGITAYAGVEENCRIASAKLKDSVFSIIAPMDADMDAILNGLVYGKEIDAEAFALVLPEPSQSTLQSEPYADIASFSAQNGLWPIAIRGDFADLKELEFHRSIVSGDTLFSLYSVGGAEIYIHQTFGYVDGMVTTMNDDTYFEAAIFDGVVMHCSVDAVDGSTAGVAVVDDSVLFIIAQKGVDFHKMLDALVKTAPGG